MRLQRFTDYLLNNYWQALVLTFLVACIPMVGMAGIVIAAFITLTVGITEGGIFTLVATLPNILLFTWILIFLKGTQEAASLSNWATITFTVMGNLLTWVFAILLRRQSSWTSILQLAALLGVLVISIIHLAYPNVADWWATQLTSVDKVASVVAQAPDMVGLAKVQALPSIPENQLEVINVIKNFATGLVIGLFLTSVIFQVMLARWWQLAINKGGRLSRELQYVHLSHLAGFLFVVAIVLYYLENRVVLDILPVLCLLFSAAGLSIVHYLCGLMEPAKGRLWLSILYIALMYSLTMMVMLPLFTVLDIMLPVVLGVLILIMSVFGFISLGLFDVWFDVRKRFHKV